MFKFQKLKISVFPDPDAVKYDEYRHWYLFKNGGKVTLGDKINQIRENIFSKI